MRDKSVQHTYEISGNEQKITEVLNVVTHGIGLLFSIAGLNFLIIKAMESGSAIEMTAYVIYGSTLILLFLSSTLYHSFYFSKVRLFFKKLDHCSIFLVIAGSYTPYALITLKESFGQKLFIVVWIAAFLGIAYKMFWIHTFKKNSTFIYILMGSISFLAIKDIFMGLEVEGFWLLAAGGLAYLLGTIFYSLRNVKYMHVVWHLFVLLGTFLVYLSILHYV